jgi:hypothetical protein
MMMAGLLAGCIVGGFVLTMVLFVTNTRTWHRRYHRNADHGYGCDHCWNESEASREPRAKMPKRPEAE